MGNRFFLKPLCIMIYVYVLCKSLCIFRIKLLSELFVLLSMEYQHFWQALYKHFYFRLYANLHKYVSWFMDVSIFLDKIIIQQFFFCSAVMFDFFIFLWMYIYSWAFAYLQYITKTLLVESSTIRFRNICSKINKTYICYFKRFDTNKI